MQATEQEPRERPARQARPALLRYPAATLVLLWLLVATGLAMVTGRVTDWFVMTDELVYERLAISVAQTGSVLPRIHGSFVRSLDQLYPLLISFFFQNGPVAFDLRQTHIAGAFLMSSACIPAFLLARRVTRRAWVGWMVALGSVAMPWIVYSAFMLTETIAYPLFLWAILVMQLSLVSPSARTDLLALLALTLAFLARTELVVVWAVLPLAIVLMELGSAPAGSRSRHVLSAFGRAARGHAVLAIAYGALLACAVGFVVSGGDLLRLSVYGREIPSNTVPHGFASALTGHFAQLAFGFGLFPFIVGFAWLLANCTGARNSRETHAFACVGSLTIALLTIEVTKYDLGIGPGIIFDRYLFYLVPVVLLGFSCAVLDRRWPRWSLLIPVALVCLGFTLRPQSEFTWADGRVNADSPVSLFYHPLIETLGSRAAKDAMLIFTAVVLTSLFALGGLRLASRRRLAPILIALAVGLLFAETGYVLVRLFRAPGTSDRSLTASIPPSMEWVDAAVGRHAHVTMVPYHVSTDYLVSQRYWRDLEFWNKSVDREAQDASAPYTFTGIWFPKLALRFDRDTGQASISPTTYVVQSVTDTRFGLHGTVMAEVPGGGKLVEADRPWRASFVTSGTYDDGWLRPGTPASVRVFASPGQSRPRIHYLSLQVWAPADVARRPFEVRSNLSSYRGYATNAATTYVNALPVCVPAAGHADITITASGSSSIPGDLSSYQASLGQRIGSIFLADASISDDLGRACKPATG